MDTFQPIRLNPQNKIADQVHHFHQDFHPPCTLVRVLEGPPAPGSLLVLMEYLLSQCLSYNFHGHSFINQVVSNNEISLNYTTNKINYLSTSKMGPSVIFLDLHFQHGYLLESLLIEFITK